jgi:hypothetical protein
VKEGSRGDREMVLRLRRFYGGMERVLRVEGSCMGVKGSQGG